MAEPPAGDVSHRLPWLSVGGDQPLTEKQLPMKTSESTPSRLGFPIEFPYEFDSSAFTSPGDSTETEEDESSDDEEDFLAGLTRRLALSTQRLPVQDKSEEKNRVIVRSPQSTLSGLGSWSASGSGSPNGPSSQVPSPPTTPFGQDDAWDVISAAAGQVARLKMSTYEPPPPAQRPNPSRTSLLLQQARVADLIASSLHEISPPKAAFWSDQGVLQYRNTHYDQPCQFLREEVAAKQQCYAAWGQLKSPCYPPQMKFRFSEQQDSKRVSDFDGVENRRYLRPMGQCRPPWLPTPPQQNTAAVRNVFPAGSVPKRSSAGTGVFLPRKYTNPSDSRKKSGSPSVVLPPSKVVQQQIRKLDEFNVKSLPCLSGGFSNYDYECLIARRNAILAQQRSLRQVGGGCLNQDMPLPQEWLY